ncbi:nitroreductase family protein [Frankia sp. AgB1.9]|uniref:nitroreductase family protein n=1 Tax=unclassified Frankia TaxID=2632575 RepID=UPI001931B1B8|nr:MULTISPECIES: nitroreductase family protein [unclassified Frankia]MBL7488095.1 nitroreductase family protein [Frankia sp. AgW1.1]MBL7548322.1 nitroreductase family protein [Frankia sp. AgB1.9]MBL7625236.1 nitroreductase family protein [Frankia sp. AgB1.8]
MHEIALRQRAHRAFTDRPVDEDVIRAILTTATRAPSAENTQPWRFVVVRDAALRARIGDLTARAWSGGGRAWAQKSLPSGLFADVDAGATGGVAAAPVLVVVSADTTACVPAVLGPSIWPCVQNLLLAAIAEGLGSALTTLATAFGDELRTLLDLAPTIAPQAVVPLGYPAVELRPGRRRPIDDVTTWR